MRPYHTPPPHPPPSQTSPTTPAHHSSPDPVSPPQTYPTAAASHLYNASPSPAPPSAAAILPENSKSPVNSQNSPENYTNCPAPI
ncbi:hypothetical protein HanIR_Chr13g0659291 [Helianthus annuus]|nr:hypothetical protein HanIR_Chr13g0659291 [Helianthus annuus]